MYILAAFSAIVMPLLLLAVFRMPAKYGMSISALVVIGLASILWSMDDIAIVASALQGMHRALSIVWILFGAILLLKVLQYSGGLHRIKAGFQTISPDMRVQAVVVGVVFVALLEGLTGFGAPIAIAAPLLVALGFRPIAAVIVGLVGDSVPVVFGAVGTPVVIGLSNVPGTDNPDVLVSIAQTVTKIDFVIAMLLPLIVVVIVVKMFGENKHQRNLQEVFEVAPWALTVGAVYAVSAALLAYAFGPELISIIAGIITLLYATLTAHHNILLHKDLDWRTHLTDEQDDEVVREISLLRAWTPYLIVIAGLAVTRLIQSVQDKVRAAVDAGWQNILGVESISSSWELLYSPGSIMAASALLVMAFGGMRLREINESVVSTLQIVKTASLALFPALIMLQVFANSGLNSAGLASMPEYIAVSLANVFSPIWIIVAPVLGALGAFIAGSSTVSALTMAEIQYSVAQAAGISTELVLAQQLSGSAAGNMIAVHNIVAASAVVAVYHQEGHIIRRLIPVVALYIGTTVITVLFLQLIGIV